MNQTLSQSVPPNVIMGISGFTKCFIGTIIERARDVQKQLATPPPTPPHPAPTSIPISLPPPNLNSSPSSPMNLDYKDDNKDKVITSENQPPMAKPASANPQYLGPLLPDHLREVMRRYKKDGEGGGTGLGGRSLGLGVTGTAVGRVRGKRLFM